MCNKATKKDPCSLMSVPHHFKTQGMCSIKVVEKYPFLLAGVTNRLKTQERCKKAVKIEPILLRCNSDHFKTQEMCNQAMRNKP